MNITLNNDYSIRSFRQSDAESLTFHANNNKIAQNLRDAFPFPYTLDDALNWIFLANNSEPETHFAITENDICIGCIGLTLQDDIFSHSAEIGFWIGEKYWGKGITTRACSKLLEYAFKELNLLRIFAYTFVENTGSIKVLEKCGMLHEGTLKNGIIKNNRLHDVVLYAKTIM